MDYEERKKYAAEVYNRNATKMEARNATRTQGHKANKKNSVKN